MGRPKSGKSAPKNKRGTILERFSAGNSTIEKPELPIGESKTPSGLVVIRELPRQLRTQTKNQRLKAADQAVAPAKPKRKASVPQKQRNQMSSDVRAWQARRPAGGSRADYIKWASEKPNWETGENEGYSGA